MLDGAYLQKCMSEWQQLYFDAAIHNCTTPRALL
jgi:hypothetical protein